MGDQRKSVLITGSSGRGIGNHLAQSFHERGFRVFATARKAESLADLQAKGIETLSLVVDDEQSVKDCYKEVCKLLDGKGLDYLVNNAGRNYTVPATDVDMAEVKLTYNTNLFAIVFINQTFLPLLLKSKGTIIHIDSVAGKFPFLFGSLYNSSKAALNSYSSCLRLELRPFGIVVLNIITGGVISDIARTKRALPATSIFKPIESAYQRRLVTSQTEGMDTRTFANQVVKAALNARGWFWNSEEVWLGSRAHLVWFLAALDRWIPGGLWNRMLPRRFGLPSRLDAPQSRKLK